MASCVMFSFLVSRYHHYGFSTGLISLLTALAALVTAGFQFVYGAISDRSRRTKPIFYAPILISAIAAIMLEWFHGMVYCVVLSVFLLSATGNAMGTLLDPWFTQLQISGIPINYGLIRCCGSLFYALISAVFGTLLDRFGFTISTFAFLILLFMMLVSLLAIREQPRKSMTLYGEKLPFTQTIRQLLTNGKYIRFLATVFFLFLGINCINTFLPLRLSELGGNNAIYGYCLLISAGCEIPFLLLSRRFRLRFTSFQLIAASLVVCLIKNMLTAFSTNVLLILFAMTLQGPFFGVYLPAYLLYVTEIVPQSLVYTATTLVATTLSVANVFASLYMGAISSSLSLQRSMITALLPLFFAVLLFFRQKQQKKNS